MKRDNYKTTNKKEQQSPIRTGSRRGHRGVGAIIGGTILAMILFTSVFVYFLVFLQNQSTQGKAELQASRVDEEKRIEAFIASSSQNTVAQTSGNPNTNYLIAVMLNNTGPLPVNATYAMVTRADDTTSTLVTPLQFVSSTGKATDQVLNPGASALFFVPAKDSTPDPSKKYHVDIVTSRGNIVSTQWPPINQGGSGNGNGGGSSSSGSGSSAIGQNNTGINIGAGQGAIYAGMNGEKLQFKRLLQGFGIQIANDTDTVMISAPGQITDGQILGCGEGTPNCENVYAGKNGVNLQFFSLKAGTGVTLAKDGLGNIVINANALGLPIGEANTASNLGTGEPVFKQKVGVDLQFKKLSGQNGIGVTHSADNNSVIISGDGGVPQGTGSVQLDFKSYAAIFPDFKTRNAIEQTGRLAAASNVHGYPVANLYGDVHTILVQRLRNLDSTGQPLTLTKSSALTTSFAGTPGNHPPLLYVCSSTNDPLFPGSGIVQLPLGLYNDAAGITLENVPPPHDPTLGWHDIYFCLNNSMTSSSAIGQWIPDTTFDSVSPVFMVMHAKYGGSQLDYGQTIPYQAFQFNNGLSLSSLVACVYGSNSNASCDSQTANSGSQPYKYQHVQGVSETLYVHINNGVGPYYVEWINNDGTHQSLVGSPSPSTATSLNSNRNIPISIPATAGTGYYTIKVTDSANISGSTQGAVFMTFRVT